MNLHAGRRMGRVGQVEKPVLRLLHVEDNPEDAILVRLQLDDMPDVAFTVDVAETLQKALASPGHLYTAALLDLDLPDSRGLDTVRAVRKRFPRLPVVVLTGRRERTLGLEALGLGVHDYVVKEDASAENLGRHLLQAVERARSEVTTVPPRRGGLSIRTVEAGRNAVEASLAEGMEPLVLLSFRRPASAARSALEKRGRPPASLLVVDAASPRRPAIARGLGHIWVGPRDLGAIATAVEEACAHFGPGCRVAVDDLAALAQGRPVAAVEEFLAALSQRLLARGVAGEVLRAGGRDGDALAARVVGRLAKVDRA